MFTSVFLWMLPTTSAAYDFKTDLREDDHTVITGVADTTANLTLFKAVYDNDTSTIDITSNDSDDIPLMVSYNVTNRLLDISGLAVSTDRTITITYDIDALEGNDAINTLLDNSSFLFITLSIAFPVAGLALVIMGIISRRRG